MISDTQRERWESIPVSFDLPEYVRETKNVMDGQPVTVEYDSRYGGIQTVEGTAELVREWEGRRRRRYLTVGDRKISSGRVFSAADGRHIGDVTAITVQMDFATALEWVSKGWHGHDVDAGDDEMYAQFWSGELDDEMSNEEWMRHTDAIRFQRED